jgi:hypothetical protein
MSSSTLTDPSSPDSVTSTSSSICATYKKVKYPTNFVASKFKYQEIKFRSISLIELCAARLSADVFKGEKIIKEGKTFRCYYPICLSEMSQGNFKSPSTVVDGYYMTVISGYENVRVMKEVRLERRHIAQRLLHKKIPSDIIYEYEIKATKKGDAIIRFDNADIDTTKYEIHITIE